MRNLDFKINFHPHAGQLEVNDQLRQSNADIITLAAARGWGKTLWATCSAVIPTALAQSYTPIMWVSPTYKICKSPIDDVFFGVDEVTNEKYITKTCPQTGFEFWDYRSSDNEIHFFNNSKVYFRSAENPDSIVSKGFKLIVIDEAALIKQEIFQRQILPTARRKGCKIIVISTPRGKNWFYHTYIDGQDSSKPNYISFQQPWWKRPDYPPLLKELMKDLPKHIRDSEFEAEFVDDGGGVFKNLSNVFVGSSIEFESTQQQWTLPANKDRFSDEEFVLAIDFAKSVDFTVIIGMGLKSKEIVYYRRVNKEDYKVILAYVKKACDMLNGPTVIFDSTGVGSGLADFLHQKIDCDTYPYTFTNNSKTELINRLIVDCEYGNLKIPNIQTVREEFELFEYSVTKTRKISYSAPDGRHDDTVIAIALANWYAEEYGGPVEVHEVNNFIKTMDSFNEGYTSIWDAIENDND